MGRPAATLDDLPWRVSLRRTHHRRILAGVAVAAVVALVGYLAYQDVLAPALAPPPPSSGPITVLFGTPSTGSVSCAGTAVPTERLPWDSASRPVTTAQVAFTISEIGDGDSLGGPNTAGVATNQSLCAGNPPRAPYEWYAVLVSPSGQDLATFTLQQGWLGIGGASLPLPISNGSAVEVLSTSSYAAHGDAFVVTDPNPSPTVNGYTAL